MQANIFYIVVFLYSNLFAQEYLSMKEYSFIHKDEIQLEKEFKKVVHAQPVATTVTKKIKIAVLIPSLQLSDYWRRNEVALTKRLDNLHINYTIDLEETHSLDSAIKESRYVDKIIKEKYDFLITTLNNGIEKRLIQKVLLTSSTKVILQNITTPKKGWESKQPLFYVGFDHKIGSLKIADYFLERFNHGDYAVIYYTQGFVSQCRGETFIEYISKNSKLNLVAEYYSNGDIEKARLATLDLLKDKNNAKNLKFIYACATDVAIGISQALESLGLKDKIMVNGWGGGSLELDMLQSKKLDVTVMRMNDDAGIAIAEVIKASLEGKKTPKIYSGELKLIDKNIDNDSLNSLKKQAFRYSDDSK